jgi:integrase
MNEETSLVPYGDGQDVTIIDAEALQITQRRAYDERLAIAGLVADTLAESEVFETYHTQQCSENTRRRQKDDLACFSAFLLDRYHFERSASDLYADAEAWRGISHGIVRGFLEWMTEQGYAAGTINGRLFTVRKDCQLAGPTPAGAGVLTASQVEAILTVRGRSAKVQGHVDENREQRGLPQRRGRKKAQAVDITTHQALTLKKATVGTTRNKQELSAADSLKIGLMVEHAFRVSEVVALKLGHFNLNEGTVTFYRPKTRTEEKHRLHTFTRRAAESYLALCLSQGRSAGPLFIGYKGQRISTRAINERVALLGKAIGVEGRLSPHDLRHFWTWDAFRNGNQLDRIVSGGGWTNPLMALRYAKRATIANEGIEISEE